MEFEELSDFKGFLINIFEFCRFQILRTKFDFKGGCVQLLTVLYICVLWFQYGLHNDLMKPLGRI